MAADVPAPGQLNKGEQCHRPYLRRAGAPVLGEEMRAGEGKERRRRPPPRVCRGIGREGKLVWAFGCRAERFVDGEARAWAYGLGRQHGPQAQGEDGDGVSDTLKYSPWRPSVTVSTNTRLAPPLLRLARAPRNQEPPPRPLGFSPHRLLPPAAATEMDQFHDGHHVWLRSRVLGAYLHAGKDGVGVSLRRRRASLNAAWAVHLHRDVEDTPCVLLHSAAYGRYLAVTDVPARRGFRVAQRCYDQEHAEAIRWQAVSTGSGDDILLRHVGDRDRYHYLRANRKYLRWKKGVSVDNFENVSDMMQWVVEPIPARLGMPAIPGPIRVSSTSGFLFSNCFRSAEPIDCAKLLLGCQFQLRGLLNVSISFFRDHLVVLFWLIFSWEQFLVFHLWFSNSWLHLSFLSQVLMTTPLP